MADENTILNLENIPGYGPIIRADQGAGSGAARDFICFKKAGSETFSVDSSGLPDPGGGDAKRQTIISVEDVPADADALETFLMYFNTACTITLIAMAADTDVLDASSNTQTLVITDSDDAAVCTYVTATASPLDAETWTTISGGGLTNEDMQAGTYLYVTYTKANSGLAMNGLTFLVEYTLDG